MSDMTTLASIALLGSDKKPLTPDLFPTALAAKIGSQNMSAIGAFSIWTRAGLILPPAVPVPPPCEVAVHEWPSDLLGAAKNILSSGPVRCRKEMVSLMRKAGEHLPDDLLVIALVEASGDKAFSKLLPSIFGPRGHWLAKTNSSWAFALTGENKTDAWDHGSSHSRLFFLKELRSTDPDSARELLSSDFKEIPLSEKLELLPVLRDGISVNDEAFLTQLMSSERSKELKRVVLDLLSLIPGAKIIEALEAAFSTMVSPPAKKNALPVIAPPETFDVEWKNLGIEQVKPKNESMGEKAWWLYQIARSIPLDSAQKILSLDPEQMMALALSSDWKDAVFSAWMQRAVEFPSEKWSRAIILTKKNGLSTSGVAGFVGDLPLGERDELWAALIGKKDSWYILHAIFNFCEKSDVYVEQKLLSKILIMMSEPATVYDYNAPGVISALAQHVAPELLPLFRESLAKIAFQHDSYQQAAVAADAVASRRLTFHQFFNGETQ